jgi:hypothetical protein
MIEFHLHAGDDLTQHMGSHNAVIFGDEEAVQLPTPRTRIHTIKAHGGYHLRIVWLLWFTGVGSKTDHNFDSISKIDLSAYQVTYTGWLKDHILDNIHLLNKCPE